MFWAGPRSADSGEEGQGQLPQGLQPSMSLLDSGGTLLLDEVDQTIGGRIVRGHWAAAIKLRFNLLSQLLSQLHSARKRRKNYMRNVPVLLMKSTSIPTLSLNQQLTPIGQSC